MTNTDQNQLLESQIDQWRSYLRRRQAIRPADVEELEDHLRERIQALMDAGLASDEAFLVGVKRLGEIDALSREFAREHSERLWKQLLVDSGSAVETRSGTRTDGIVAFCLAVAAAIALKVPGFLGMDFDADASFYARNMSFFVLPFLAGYFVWKRRLTIGTIRWIAGGLVAAGVLANVYPLTAAGSTEVLTAMHVPMMVWLLVGVAYAGGRWGQVSGRMDFIRFTGELAIYYVLIAIGGGVFTAFMAMLFQAIGLDAEPFFEQWVIPTGAAGAVIIASWLVEAKQSVIENMAPVLTRLFTPLFAALLLAFLGTMLWTGRTVGFERDILIAFDLLLIVVLGLLLYSISARDPRAPAGAFDVLQVVLVLSALVANGVALWAIASRITEYGFTPNRAAALGENVILLVNLAWSAVLYIRFLTGRESFSRLEKWQTDYVPVYAIWASIVVIVFPPLFGYI